jgi:hypothetical protein
VKTPDLCCVRIGYEEFLLPADKGLKLIALMQGALVCKHTYDSNHNRVYRVTGRAELHLETVAPDQVDASEMPSPAPQAARTKRLGVSVPLLPNGAKR